MSTYTRPLIKALVFKDESGAVIDFGNRWANLESPPEDMYSVIEHPERFAPLHTVASAVVKHLIENYEVEIDEGYHVLSEHPHAPDPDHVTRALQLNPSSKFSAPITFVWTNGPAIRIYAGALFEAAYPSCACNACDERWDECADELEEQVFAIVSGGLTEHISKPRRPKWSFEWGKGFVQGMGQTVSYDLNIQNGSSRQSGEVSAESIPIEMLEIARDTLNPLQAVSPHGNWLPWPEKRRTP